MKYFNLVLLFFAAIALSNCKQPKPNNLIKPHNQAIINNHDTLSKESFANQLVTDTAVKLRYGFELKLLKQSRHGENPLYAMQIWHRNVIVYTDNSDTASAYLTDGKPYPILNKLKSGDFELLLEYDNRPSKNLVLVLRISENKIISRKEIPSFDNDPEVINGLTTYYGKWDYGESWEENGKFYTVYNPSIYYKFTDHGIIIDTPLTIMKNKQVYGRFEGFTYSSEIGYPSTPRGKIIDTTARNILRKHD